MNRKHITILILVILCAFIFHSAAYFFLDKSQYNLYDTDTWYAINGINKISKGENLSPGEISWGIVLPILGSLFVSKTDTPRDIFNKAGFLPPILSALFTLIIYFVVGKLFDEDTGFYSAILISIGTGVFYQNTMFGIIDHHLFECMYGTCTILCLLIVLKNKSLIWCIPTFICGIFLYFNSDMWGVYFPLAGICLIIYLIIQKNIVLILLSLIPISCIAYFKFSNINLYLNMTLQLDPVNELKIIDPLAFLVILNILFLPILLGVVNFSQTKKIKDNITLFSLFIVTILLTLLTIRFERIECLLIPIACILFAAYPYEIEKDKVLRTFIPIFLLSCILCGGILTNNVLTIAHNNSGWNDGLNYLNAQEPGIVLSWWDYGYWIRAIGNKTEFCNNAGIYANTAAKIFLDPPNEELLRQNKIKYIIINKNDGQFYDLMRRSYKTSNPYSENFLNSLIKKNSSLQLIFDNNSILIYKNNLSEPIGFKYS